MIIEGEYWVARSRGGVVKPGEEVIVVGKDGPTLIVEKASKGGSAG